MCARVPYERGAIYGGRSHFSYEKCQSLWFEYCVIAFRLLIVLYYIYWYPHRGRLEFTRGVVSDVPLPNAAAPVGARHIAHKYCDYEIPLDSTEIDPC